MASLDLWTFRGTYDEISGLKSSSNGKVLIRVTLTWRWDIAEWIFGDNGFIAVQKALKIYSNRFTIRKFRFSNPKITRILPKHFPFGRLLRLDGIWHAIDLTSHW